MQNIAGKKRACQKDMISDYLFDVTDECKTGQ
jgi:hypothetical protein